MAKASNLALTGAWYQKWLVHSPPATGNEWRQMDDEGLLPMYNDFAGACCTVLKAFFDELCLIRCKPCSTLLPWTGEKVTSATSKPDLVKIEKKQVLGRDVLKASAGAYSDGITGLGGISTTASAFASLGDIFLDRLRGAMDTRSSVIIVINAVLQQPRYAEALPTATCRISLLSSKPMAMRACMLTFAPVFSRLCRKMNLVKSTHLPICRCLVL